MVTGSLSCTSLQNNVFWGWMGLSQALKDILISLSNYDALFTIGKRSSITKITAPRLIPPTETSKAKKDCQNQFFQNLGIESRIYSTQADTKPRKTTSKL